MGIFLASPRMLYAIHVPHGESHIQLLGAAKFIDFLRNMEDPGGLKNLKMYCVLNGGNRSDIRKDLEPYAAKLGLKQITVVRFYKNIEAGSSNSDKFAQSMKAVVATFQRGGTANDFIIKYMQESKVVWKEGKEGGGRPRFGWYQKSFFDGVKNADLNQGDWILATNDNSYFSRLNY